MRFVLALAAFLLAASSALAQTSAEAGAATTTWTHAPLGLSMSYPSSMTLATDRETLTRMMGGGAEIADTAGATVAPVGPVFALFLRPVGEVPNPTMTMTTMELPKGWKKQGPDEFARQVLASVGASIPASRQVEDATRNDVAGRAFWSGAWEFVANGTLARVRAYISLDIKRNRGLIISFADDAMAFADRTKPFEDVIRSMRIE